MSSRSATVLVIFMVACIAFCLASVFGAMTGPISILPSDDSGGVLDNLSAITDSNDAVTTYGYDDSQDYSQSDDDSSSSDVETTTDSSQSSSSSSQSSSSSSSSSNVETYSEPASSSSSSQSQSSSSDSNVETTVG